ncbi:MAG: hypothetical protein E7490_04580 [Ruminococcaceae bacterium]|nr:hypothetical protein [Oscillospiraceae bacterium]
MVTSINSVQEMEIAAKFIVDKMKSDPEFEARMLQNQKRTLCELLDPRLSNPVYLDMTIERALQLYNKK